VLPGSSLAGKQAIERAVACQTSHEALATVCDLYGEGSNACRTTAKQHADACADLGDGTPSTKAPCAADEDTQSPGICRAASRLCNIKSKDYCTTKIHVACIKSIGSISACDKDASDLARDKRANGGDSALQAQGAEHEAGAANHAAEAKAAVINAQGHLDALRAQSRVARQTHDEQTPTDAAATAAAENKAAAANSAFSRLYSRRTPVHHYHNSHLHHDHDAAKDHTENDHDEKNGDHDENDHDENDHDKKNP